MKSSCKCKGASVLLEMAELYKSLGEKKFKSNQLDRKKAATINDKILDIISQIDIYKEGDRASLWGHFLDQGKRLNYQCKEGLGEQCIMALENLRAAIHGDWGLRAKLMCESDEEKKPPFSEDNELILRAMYALRGAFYGTPKDAIRMLQELKNKYC